MTGTLSCILAAATGLALAACASPAPLAKEAAMSTADASRSSTLMPAKEWPLRFSTHSFGVHCYDTYACKVVYAGRVQRDDDSHVLRPSSAGYGPDYQRNWTGIHGLIGNFPPPAFVTWRSRDGAAHQASIDVGVLFKDELIRHSVPRDAIAHVPDGKFSNEPAVLLEVNDRTIRVYTRTHVPTKRLQKPGNEYSDFRNDLILIETYTF